MSRFQVWMSTCLLVTAALHASYSMAQTGGRPRADGLPIYRVINLGTLGGESSGASALNQKGEVAGWSLTGSGARHAFAYRNGNMTDIGTLPGGTESTATGINDQGQVSGYGDINEYGSGFAGISQAFIWDNGTLKTLGALYCPCTFNTRYGTSVAQDINNSGIVPGWSGTVRGVSVFHAFRWSATAGLQDIGGGAGNWSVSRGWAINNRGTIVGDFARDAGRLTAYNRVAVRWEADTMVELGMLAGHTSSTARDIDEQNRIVGWSWADNEEDRPARAVLWHGDEIRDLGTLPGDIASRAKSINARAHIVGWSGTMDQTLSRAFLWIDGVMLDLNDHLTDARDWVLTEACAINDAGQIVGTGLYRGKPRAYLLQPERAPLVQRPEHPLLRAVKQRLR